MSKIRITQAGWEGFTGHLGDIEFVDGVSVESLGRTLIDRVSGIVHCSEVDDAGKTADQAGAAQRMVGGVTVPLSMEASLRTLTPEELAEEHKLTREQSGRAPVKVFYSEKDLIAIGEKLGIHGLREIAKPWNVKERMISKLIYAILKAQDAYKLRAAKIEEDRKIQVARAQNDALAKQRARELEIDKQARILTPSTPSSDQTPNTIDADGKLAYVDPDAKLKEWAPPEGLESLGDDSFGPQIEQVQTTADVPASEQGEPAKEQSEAAPETQSEDPAPQE